MIKVLIVDDSLVQRELFIHILNSDPEITVIDTATNGEEAIQKAMVTKPDVVTMDLHMPKMDGIEATKILMSTNPVPIIIISGSSSPQEISNTFQAMEAGAVTVVDKLNYVTDNFSELVNTVKLMSQIKVVKRFDHLKKAINKHKTNFVKKTQKMQLISLGASTGGPMILQEILKNFPTNFPPVLIVQHISPGFLGGLAEWLSKTTNVLVKIAVQGEPLRESQVYLAPDGYQMGVGRENKILLSNDEPENGHRPSVSYLFRSTAKNLGNMALGILLTGMGRDGADGLKLMKEAGAVTIAQDEESSIIFGMPGEAIKIGAAQIVLSPIEIANYIKTQIGVEK